MWPQSADELMDAQRALARADPPPWRPPAGPLAIGACAVCFAPGADRPLAIGPDSSPRADRPAAGPLTIGHCSAPDADGADDAAWAAAAVQRGRRTLARAVTTGVARAPYAAGVLALREGPLLEAAVRALDLVPDVLLVDATGRDHPRRAGLALHLGAVLGLPTVGVTHRPLLASGDWPTDDERGATAPLAIGDEHVGAWLRTRAGARPIATHPGWRTDVDVAAEVVLAASRGHRTPEPLRFARRLARLARAGRSTSSRADVHRVS
jgi:deoxyribonuclease V